MLSDDGKNRKITFFSIEAHPAVPNQECRASMLIWNARRCVVAIQSIHAKTTLSKKTTARFKVGYTVRLQKELLH